MSLLMDALRKAEQQKQKLAASGSSPTIAADLSGLSLEPRPDPVPSVVEAQPPSTPEATKPAPGRLPDLPSRLEDLDEQFMAHVAQASAPKPSPPSASPVSTATELPKSTPPVRETIDEPSPAAARNLFEAKLPAPKNNRNFAIAIGLATLIAGIGLGGYLWWEMQPKSSLMAGNAIRPPQPTSPTPAPSPVPAPPPAVIAAPSIPPAQPVPPAPTSVAVAKPASPEMADDDEAEKPRPAATRQSRPAPPPAERAVQDKPLRVQAMPKKIDPAVDQAYEAFNRGETAQAELLWKKALSRDPRNSDALHGMAAIALRDNNPALAAEYYGRALENDPKDGLALSGLMALRAPTDPLQAESRLKLLLAEQPGSSHLNFALGNLYARGARWNEAQQAYFKAHTADPANPDYLFNLAVSLDQLHQRRLAAQYYEKAITAATRQPAGFDADGAATRLKALQSDTLQ